MSKHKLTFNRLNELLQQIDSIHPEPNHGNPLGESSVCEFEPASLDASDFELRMGEDALEAGSGNGRGERRQLDSQEPEHSIGWEDFLNAIDRQEHIGYTYNIAEIEPQPVNYPFDQSGQPENMGNSQLRIPLVAGESPIGAIQLDGDGRQEWSDQEIGVVESIARQVVQHLENLRLVEQANRYRQEAEQALRRLTRQGWEEYAKTQATQMGYVYDQNQVLPMQPHGKENTSRWSPEAVLAPALLETLKIRDEAIGQLAIYEPEQLSQELVSVIAERLSTHIEGLRLLEQTEQNRRQLDWRAAELETVARVSTAAATILDPMTLLQSVVDLTRSSFQLYHAYIYLLDSENGRLVLKAGSGEKAIQMLAKGHIVSLEESTSLLAEAARTRRAMVANDLAGETVYQRHPLLSDTLSELAVPLVVGDELMGIFDVHANSAQRFSQDDIQIYSTLAAQVAVALRNAELYAQQMATVERLRELDHLKSSFLANMSHELRTPLNSILGFTQVILEGLDGPLTELMINDLELVEKNGKHLLNLINDVLDMAKIEAGRLTLSFESFDLRELISDVLETTQSLARNKSLYLKQQIDPKHDLTIKADRFRIRQILINLVGNAIKFTEEGGVTINAERMGERIRLSIRDTGIGIPPEKLDSIFEAFSQVDTSSTRKAGGTGLGLPISRRLVEMHGGRLWAESTGVALEGSTFWLELPVEATGQG